MATGEGMLSGGDGARGNAKAVEVVARWGGIGGGFAGVWVSEEGNRTRTHWLE